MRLNQAVHAYVEHKQANGVGFSKGAQCLRSFLHHVGNKPLDAIHERHTLSFLDGPLTSTVTWRSKHGLLRHFFMYWVTRSDLIGVPLPPIRPPVAQTFVPYIYSRAELRRIFAATRVSQSRDACRLDARTLRTLLLFLYGTGALVGEARHLRLQDIDFRRRKINIRSGRFNRSREIPIGPDLYKILRAYSVAIHKAKVGKATYFFISKDRAQMNETTLAKSFQRLRIIAGIKRSDGSQYQPRLHDLRHTFAVHRTTSWFKHGADLNRMMPALSAYLGQVGLASTERYLAMTPERFRAQLDLLSPKRSRSHWRDKVQLMQFLDTL